ncbi:MAG: hypothetical protein HKN96_06625 [Flavobacteriaceae bacterium]|nr:hypothetical protein [Flavobacteriaceae bacterium]NNE14944.1 hypothetical protein [Saprospiraceae bacterium]
MEKNKTGKYFKYAIGEIVLVVIGILIALQINNWNEGRKNNQRETLILKEILNSINKDLKYNEDVVDRLIERKRQGLDSLETYIVDKKPIQDSLFLNFYSDAGQIIALLYDNGPYEALKSSGLELITNDSLRSAINNLYAFDLPTFTSFSNIRNDQTYPEISELRRNFIKLTPGPQKEDYIPRALKVDDILNNQDFLLVYNLERNKYRIYTYWLKNMRTSLSDLKTQIEKELEK